MYCCSEFPSRLPLDYSKDCVKRVGSGRQAGYMAIRMSSRGSITKGYIIIAAVANAALGWFSSWALLRLETKNEK